MTLMVRVIRRPRPVSVLVWPGTSRQGSVFSRFNSPGWLALTVRAKSASAARIAVAVSVWVCIASKVMTHPARSAAG